MKHHWNTLKTLVFVALMISVSSTACAAVQQINWETLKPKLTKLVNPLANLTIDQVIDFDTIAWVRGMSEKEKNDPNNQESVVDAKKFEQQFAAAGLDVTDLITRHSAFAKEAQRRQNLLNTSLDNKTVRLSGYLLPLQFSEEGETEFLLVPYIGACVHAPAPPPNQVVFVRLSKKFQASELFTPVWVSGLMKTQASKASLEMGDGNLDVDAGYHLEPASVEIYQQK